MMSKSRHIYTTTDKDGGYAVAGIDAVKAARQQLLQSNSYQRVLRSTVIDEDLSSELKEVFMGVLDA